jgi:hypothetical protein
MENVRDSNVIPFFPSNNRSNNGDARDYLPATLQVVCMHETCEMPLGGKEDSKS